MHECHISLSVFPSSNAGCVLACTVTFLPSENWTLERWRWRRWEKSRHNIDPRLHAFSSLSSQASLRQIYRGIAIFLLPHFPTSLQWKQRMVWYGMVIFQADWLYGTRYEFRMIHSIKRCVALCLLFPLLNVVPVSFLVRKF